MEMGIKSKEDKKNFNVLLAEDCPDSRMLLSHLLQQSGAKVTCANNGSDAIEQVLSALSKDDPFDILLFDIQMPELDGLSATRELRARGYSHPIIAMTARSTPNDIDESFSAGCDAHISKLAGSVKILEEVKRHVEQLSTPKSQELPALPVVPSLLKENPGYASRVLPHIKRLPATINSLTIAAEKMEFEVIESITHELGAFSLYGYSTFSEQVRNIQLAAKECDASSVDKSLRKLRRAADGVLLGETQVTSLAARGHV